MYDTNMINGDGIFGITGGLYHMRTNSLEITLPDSFQEYSMESYVLKPITKLYTPFSHRH